MNEEYDRFEEHIANAILENTTMLKHATGNLIDMAEAGDFDVIIQGCNCMCAMGGGIAREIAERYPLCAEIDRLTERGEHMKLGNWTEFDTGHFIILNAYTQYDVSRSRDVFEYTAFQLILEKVAHAYGTLRIGLPYIGMGLAGGDPKWIMPMIEHFAKKIDNRGGSVTLVEYKQG